jgi:hypothetical protein
MYFQNIFYAKVGGVSKKEVNKLEYEFLVKLDFDVYISEEVYKKYHNYLDKINEKIIIEDALNGGNSRDSSKQHKEVFVDNDDDTTEGGEVEQWEK